jgi:hypothetical protein
VLFERLSLRIGTAHSFQGEERDVMLISFCLDAESDAMSFRFLDKADVFNVSVTRARYQQRIFYSFDSADALEGGFVASYIDRRASGTGGTSAISRAAPRSATAADVAGVLRRLYSAETLTNVLIAGVEVDVAYRINSQWHGVDIVDGAMTNLTVERMLTLDRAGLRVYPLPYSEWCIDPIKSVIRCVGETGKC